VTEFTWVLHDASGKELRTTDPFPSKDLAEAWMGSEWSVLLDEGAEKASLAEDGRILYTMGLRET
jgi:hypothetical protein